ncbi:hypothetical protein [Mesorhizobium sp. WSM3860]|uniref:hypothetical protein n=1 Tax=Mesorhizobium sp. WSM3860 TaxID=2029403 RepID=UPI000BAEFD91|nr:hypothetical protein [Mesorhizobium sp. WSM3860]PBC02053.1 hypothetical protein CK220_22975 [Mesorhizobium sp. WSM3860]
MLDTNVERGHFRGHGATYFPVKELGNFLASLQAYPLQRTELTLKSPGVIAISVFPADGVGHLFVQIEVADDVEARDLTRVRLRTDYSRLSGFANQLSLMAKGEITEIFLEEDKTLAG